MQQLGQGLIRDNHQRGTVGEFLKQAITPDADLAIVSAYFTMYAFQHLKNRLRAIKHLKFLFGEPTFLQAIDPDRTQRRAFTVRDDSITLIEGLQQGAAARECAAWMREKVTIKSMVKPNFLHGKMYHIQQASGMRKAILGSSNFTVNGLGLGNSPNIELNVEIDSDRDRQDLLDWFNAIWNDDTGLVEDVKAEVLSYLEQLYVENAPEFVYFKTLYQLFADYLAEQQAGGLLTEQTGFFETGIWKALYDFQKDGVKGAINKILKHNGCIIADSVGLGKTFEALAVIKYFELLNQRVLVLCPKKLRDNWSLYRRVDELNPFIADRFRYDVLNHTDLSRERGMSGDIDLATILWGHYDLVVIDESHNFRNNTKGRRDEEGQIIRKSRYERLLEDIIATGVNTKVLLLSATPVNSNLRDLRNQIYIITGSNDEALFEKTQIRSITQTLKNAQTTFTNWANPQKNPQRLVKDLLERLDSAFFKLLDELTIARSRKHIVQYYDLQAIGNFPARLPVISKTPAIDLKKRFPSYDKLNQDILQYKLALFNPSAYIKPEYKTMYAEKAGARVQGFTQENREHYLIGMMKVNFLKRLESCIQSFEISLDRTIQKIDRLIQRIQAYQAQSQADATLDAEIFQPPDDDDDEDLAALNEQWQVGKTLQLQFAHLDRDAWLQDLEADRDQLVSLYNNAEAVTVERDAKLHVLKELITQKVAQPINADNKKVLIFTAFADTAFYLYDALRDWARQELGLHIAVVTGGSDHRTTFTPAGYKHQQDFNQILINFAPLAKQRAKMPHTMPQTGAIDILIATDCLSEGQNLQDCDYLINYDIHWNPVRIIQRFGRIDRIGSKNAVIQLVNFWPTDDLNHYLNLKDRVEARMALVDLTATGEENLLNTEQIQALLVDELTYRDKQLLRLKDEILDLEDMAENVSLSEFTLDDFRIELLNFLDDQSFRRKLEDAPDGLYAVVPAPSGQFAHLADYAGLSVEARNLMPPGVIFCLAQTGDTAGNETVNPLQPYFLVYIRHDGTVRLNYTNAKQMLEIFRLLCQGQKEPYQMLCDVLNGETHNGADMATYSRLLLAAIADIARVFRKRSLHTLFASRDGKLADTEKQVSGAEHFRLVTWLIIK